MRCDPWELTQTAQDALGKVLEHDKQVDKAREEAKKQALERRSGSNGVVGIQHQ